MSTSDIITVNDTVAATQGNTNQKGYVRFIGERNNEIGTFYGVDFEATENLKFFKRNVLRLVTRSETVRITVGDIVNVKKFPAHGIVRYIGNIKSREEQIWYGVQMETAIGKNNGTVLGEQYFRCPPKHGIFVQSDNLELVKHKKNGSKSKHKKKSSKVRLGHKKTSSTATAAAALPTMGEEEPSTDAATTSATASPEPPPVDGVEAAMPSTYKASLNSGVYGGYLLSEKVDASLEMPSTYKASLNSGVYGGYWFEESTEVTMPSTYKASLNSGVYGGYLLSENSLEMPSTYKASLNSGVYGGYLLSDSTADDIPVCKYVKREDLKFWTNRIPPPDLKVYENLRAHQSTDDEIYEQMLKDDLPAYWINKFFLFS